MQSGSQPFSEPGFPPIIHSTKCAQLVSRVYANTCLLIQPVHFQPFASYSHPSPRPGARRFLLLLSSLAVGCMYAIRGTGDWGTSPSLTSLTEDPEGQYGVQIFNNNQVPADTGEEQCVYTHSHQGLEETGDCPSRLAPTHFHVTAANGAWPSGESYHKIFVSVLIRRCVIEAPGHRSS